MYKKVLFLISLLLVSCELWAPPIPVSSDGYADPDYTRLETVVRIKIAEGEDGTGIGDYRGMQVVVETRQRDSQHFAWIASIGFRGHPEWFDVPTFSEVRSEVQMDYCTHSRYYAEDRGYGTVRGSVADSAGPPLGSPGRTSLRITKKENIVSPAGAGPADGHHMRNHHKLWIHENAAFEWNLPHVYTIRDLVRVVQSLRMEDGRYPKYLRFGYSSGGGCLNCVGFSMMILRGLGINVDEVPYIRDRISTYRAPTPWGWFSNRVASVLHVASGAATGGGGMWVLGTLFSPRHFHLQQLLL